MERRQAPRCGARGGEVVQASGSSRARVGAGLASVAVAAGVGSWLWSAADDEQLAQSAVLATALAVLGLAAALVLRRAGAIPFAIALLASPYVAILALETDGIDTAAPALAGALYLVAELAYWSLELRGHIADEAGTYLRRSAVLLGLVLTTVALGTGLLVVVEVVAARGAVVDVLGTVAAVGAIALLALAAARRAS